MADVVRSKFDAIVLGVGGMGSAACLELTKRSHRVLGLERFPLVHDRGSSHGESRIIRKAYFEHPDYVPLLHRAYELWHELEQATEHELFLKTGLVLSGPANGDAIAGARLSAEQHHLEIENLTPKDATTRFPGLSFPNDHEVVFEPGAGTLRVEACVKAHIDEAVRRGATILGEQTVTDWTSDGFSVRVRTRDAEYTASKLVIAAGAWATECLASLNLPLQVLRKFVGWFRVPSGAYSSASGTPAYLYELPTGAFYGFPSYDGSTVKVAEHSNGQPVSNRLEVDRACHADDLNGLREFVKKQLPDAEPTLARHSVCLYTMTPDKHFIVDLHPQFKNVAIAAGFSGHGFKFCPVVGQILAELVESGSTSLPIQFLSLSRPAITGQ